MKMKKTILFLAILSIAGCGNSADSSDDFVESGNEYFDNGNYDKARLEYKNAIQIDPRQAEPYYRLALIDEQNKNWKQMFANLTTVEQLDPNHADALVKLGRLYLLGGQIDDALTRTNKALEVKPDDFNAQVLKASIFAKQKKFDEASALLAKISKDYPDHKDVLSLDILISKDKGDLQTALEKSKAAVAKYPEDMSLRLIQLTLYNEMKDYNGMASVYEVMLQRKPDEREIVISYARLLVTMLNKYQEAMQVVESYLANHPDDSDVQQMLLALIDQKDPQQALVKLDEMIKASPDNYELKFAKAAFLDKNGDRNASVEQLNKIVSEDPQGLNGNRARVMLANYYASQQDLAKASELVEAVLAVAPEESGALLVRAKINLANDKVDQAVTNLRTVIRNTPESDEALLLLAQAYQKQGSEELAADSYRQTLTANPYNPIAAAIVASNLVKEPNYARAEQVLIKALEKNQTNVNLLQQLAQIRILKKDWAAGIETIDMLKDQQGDTVLSLMLSGQLYQAQGDYSTAKQEYMAVLEKQPNMSQAMEGLAVSMEALSENAELEAYLTEFNNTHPDLMVGYATLAIHYFRIEKSDEAIALLNKKNQ
ncbi:MAG TPA: tetratricopeptide repeat protein [Methylophaga aminisulfidivorans]|uniref:Tetratricopeptide repeat protein n=1 Tax=Methylophaga aminisulfidivorans TaxID=230105 RepID=A0A7C1VY69_9GAMM|nr:tetratricopeptide repeat protein [Methylophaga aminisulfidivorans]